jgi:hypothetical protein
VHQIKQPLHLAAVQSWQKNEHSRQEENSGSTLRSHVPHGEVVVSSVRHEAVSALDQGGRQGTRIRNDVFAVPAKDQSQKLSNVIFRSQLLEAGLQRFSERNSNGRNGVFVRSALDGRKDGKVHRFFQIVRALLGRSVLGLLYASSLQTLFRNSILARKKTHTHTLR